MKIILLKIFKEYFYEQITSIFAKKKYNFSPKRYLLDVLSQMAQAVFASLLIGLIFKTIGEQGQSLLGEHDVFTQLIELGNFAMKFVGPAIGVAVAFGLEAPPLVMFTSVITGALGASVGGEAGAIVSSIVGI